jgi:hypothetical protein
MHHRRKCPGISSPPLPLPRVQTGQQTGRTDKMPSTPFWRRRKDDDCRFWPLPDPKQRGPGASHPWPTNYGRSDAPMRTHGSGWNEPSGRWHASARRWPNSGRLWMRLPLGRAKLSRWYVIGRAVGCAWRGRAAYSYCFPLTAMEPLGLAVLVQVPGKAAPPAVGRQRPGPVKLATLEEQSGSSTPPMAARQKRDVPATDSPGLRSRIQEIHAGLRR